mmetsp:Transcript_39374/g.64082  ORF Transcript_39374/g.64082 Transcript_39374/m.64082 type:complete len:168 (-) Transcript_39374:1499-2002(-)
MDSMFNELKVLPVSFSLVAKAIIAFEKIVSADPSDLEANAELKAAIEMQELLKTAKAGQAFETIHDSVGWAGIVSEGHPKSLKKVIVLTNRHLMIFRPRNLNREYYKVSLDRVGLLKLCRKSNHFKVCIPSAQDIIFHCDLAPKVCKQMSALIANVNHNNLRYKNLN